MIAKEYRDFFLGDEQVLQSVVVMVVLYILVDTLKITRLCILKHG